MTCYPPGYAIICPKHYRLVDPRLKALRRRARRQGRHAAADRLWQKIRRQAIERAVGLN